MICGYFGDYLKLGCGRFFLPFSFLCFFCDLARFPRKRGFLFQVVFRFSLFLSPSLFGFFANFGLTWF